jgi:hypothetical protein
MEVAMFDMSNPHSWELVTNLSLVAVAFIALIFIGAPYFRKVFADRMARVSSAFQKDAHTLILPDLGITMADGGEKMKDAPASGKADARTSKKKS